MESDVNKALKRHILVWKYVIWRIDRQKRSHGATVRVTKRPKKQRNLTYLLNTGKLGIYQDNPRRRIEIKFCMAIVFGDSSKVQVSFKSVKWFPKCGGRNLPFPVTVAVGLYSNLYYSTSRDRPYCDNIWM